MKELSIEETNAPIAYGKYVDECLNEATKHFFSAGEDKYSAADLFYAGVRCGKSWIKRCAQSLLRKQVSIEEEKVQMGAKKDIALSIMDFLDRNTTGMCLSNMECADLESAVVDSDWSKIYNYMKKKLEKQDKESADSYCQENCKGFQETGKCFADGDCKAKIEAESIDKDEIKIPIRVKDGELQEAVFYIPKGFHAEIDDDKVIIKKGEKPTVWSEEDKVNLEKAIWYVENPAPMVVKDSMLVEWLKSLKDRSK